MSDSVAMETADADFLDVTEVAGTPISEEQLDRLAHRYLWAAEYCGGKDVAELACGTGPGLGLLQSVAKSLEAGDFSSAMVQRVRAHYGNRVKVAGFDAARMPYDDGSKDVLIIFEAIYYLSDVSQFIAECRRVLRPGGRVLIATANKDLEDFNPSPHSHRYLGVRELTQEFGDQGFSTQCFGYLDTEAISWRQRLFRPIKKLVVNLGLMPRTMRGKQLLKRLVFGRLVLMPAEYKPAARYAYVPPQELPGDRADHRHKVVYCAATLNKTLK